ncbi:hypothetical protein J3459_022471 [Metarhizium acridum]|nr:hypothetical protein J3459_022471 [Metarhizium acridum]
MTQVDKLRDKGITGKGVKIALLDSGIDYEHPALGGCFGPGCLVSFGADLLKNEPTPKDCNGHGTQVAGIIAAKPNPLGFTGAAPGVQLGMYRVACNEVLPSDILVEAIHLALKEGVDIISSSVGNPGGWPDSLLSKTAMRAVDQGVVFVQGAGNDGEGGLFSNLDPAVSPGVISVGMMQNSVVPSLLNASKYTIDNEPEVAFPFYPTRPYGDFTGSPMEVYAPSVAGSSAAASEDVHACGPFQDNTPDLSDKLVLMRVTRDEGECNFQVRIKAAREKGAKSFIIYLKDQKARGVDLPTLADGVVAVGFLDSDVATSMLEAIKAGRKVVVTAFPSQGNVPLLYREQPNRNAGAVSALSSWGPSWNLGLKPSLAAIGEQVVTTSWRVGNASGYGIRRGTSSSAPLIAGIVALIIEARRSKTAGSLGPVDIQNLLVSHSHPQLYHDGKNFLSYLAPVAQQGGGLVRAYDAANAMTLVAPASLNFNDTEHRVPSLSFTLKNVGQVGVTYSLSHVPAITVYAFTQDGMVSAPKNIDRVEAPAALTLRETTVTVAPGSSATVHVSASAPDGLETGRLPIWSGWIAVNGSDGSSLSLPYQGVSGSIRQHQVLPPNGMSLFYQNIPISESPNVKLPPQGSVEASNLMFNISATLGVPLLRAEAVPLGPDNTPAAESLGQLQGFPVRWLPNNLEGTNPDLLRLVQFRWNGKLDAGNYAPEGSYKLVVRALRIFGNPDNKEDWDVRESPRFSITY